MTERRRFRVHGRVQGVGFRFWATREGEMLGLRGYVRNEADGSVVVEAEGKAVDLDRLEEQLKQGPRFASVDSVANEPPGDQMLPDAFEVRF